MFRSRRNALVKRLWKTRLRSGRICGNNRGGSRGHDISSDGPRSLEGCFTHFVTEDTEDDEGVEGGLVRKVDLLAFLEQLQLDQLEELLLAVQGRVEVLSCCIMVPKKFQQLPDDVQLPPFVCCHLWRWPDVRTNQLVLRSLPFCTVLSKRNNEDLTLSSFKTKQDDDGLTCCNPYHWSRIAVSDVSDAPPESFICTSLIKSNHNNTWFPVDKRSRDSISDKLPLSLTCETCSSSTSTYCKHWCTIAYWELRQRVGRPFIVDKNWTSIFQQLPQGDGMCLSQLQTETSDVRLQKVRDRIGCGIIISQTTDGIWLHNQSSYPIFVNHLVNITDIECFTKIEKLLSGYSIQIFDHSWCDMLKRTRNFTSVDGPTNPYCVQVSFVKGWGFNYSRQTIMQCPCWIEILLHVNR